MAELQIEKRDPKLTKDVQKLLNIQDGDLELILKHFEVSHKECEEKVRQVHEWYEKQPHLPQGQLHDQFIVAHLILKAFSIERAKKTIDNYFTARNRIPDLLKNRDTLSPELTKCMKDESWIILPKKTDDGCRVAIYRLKNRNPDMVLQDVMKVCIMMVEYRLHSDMTLGEHWIMDFTNTEFKNSLQFTPTLVSKILYFMQSCCGPKLKGMHLVHLPSYAESIFSLFKKSLKLKLVKRIHTYNKFEDILKIFPKRIIPCDLGGEEISCQEITDGWVNAFQSSPWREWFLAQDEITTDETKREVPLKPDNFFGIDGSFRKLDLD